jgi:hypothetical protein
VSATVEKWLMETWEAVDFPLVNAQQGKWHNRNATLSGLKALLSRENLKQYEDYVIFVNAEHKDYRVISIRFKDEGQGLILLMQWLGSNYYKERT